MSLWATRPPSVFPQQTARAWGSCCGSCPPPSPRAGHLPSAQRDLEFREFEELHSAPSPLSPSSPLRVTEMRRQRASDGTLKEDWSEVVPSHEAAGVGEGWGAGAGRLAAQSLGDVAVALVVAVIHRAGPVLTGERGLQGCRGSRGVSRPGWAAVGSPSPQKASRMAFVSFTLKARSVCVLLLSRSEHPTILSLFQIVLCWENFFFCQVGMLPLLLREWRVYQTPCIRKGPRRLAGAGPAGLLSSLPSLFLPY